MLVFKRVVQTLIHAKCKGESNSKIYGLKIVYINHQFPIAEFVFSIFFNCKKLNGFISEIKCYINYNDPELTRSFQILSLYLGCHFVIGCLLRNQNTYQLLICQSCQHNKPCNVTSSFSSSLKLPMFVTKMYVSLLHFCELKSLKRGKLSQPLSFVLSYKFYSLYYNTARNLFFSDDLTLQKSPAAGIC